MLKTAAPRYVRETIAGAARLQEMTTPGQYAALVRRAGRLLDNLFRVEVRLERELMVKIAMRERFDRARVERAVLAVATHRLIEELAEAWSVWNRQGRRRSTSGRPQVPVGQPRMAVRTSPDERIVSSDLVPVIEGFQPTACLSTTTRVSEGVALKSRPS